LIGIFQRLGALSIEPFKIGESFGRRGAAAAMVLVVAVVPCFPAEADPGLPGEADQLVLPVDKPLAAFDAYDERSLIIRSYFNGTWGYEHPQTVNGYYSTQLLQTLDSFVKEYTSGGYQSYQDLISKHLIDLK